MDEGASPGAEHAGLDEEAGAPAPPTATDAGGRVTAPAERRSSRDDALVAVVAVAAAVAAALSPASPTGTAVGDVVWCALAGLAVTWAAARADSLPVAWLGAVAAVVGVGGGWVAATCGVLALVVGVLDATSRRPDRLLGALVGALAVNALLRGPSYGFLGLPTLVALVAVAPALWSAWRRAPRPERRAVGTTAAVVAGFVVVASLAAAVVALMSRSDLDSAADDSEAALAILRDGDLDEAIGPLAAAADGFGSAADRIGGPLGLAGRLVPVVGQHVEALRRVSAAGEELTTTARVAAESADYEKLKADNGRVDLAEVEAMAVPVRDSADAVLSAQEVVSEVRSPWLLPLVTEQLDRLDEELADTAPTAVDAADALAVAPALLGAGGEQRYLLLFATPGESRGAGGFVGTYGVLTATDGALDLAQTGSVQELGYDTIADVSAIDRRLSFEPPPGWQELYGEYNVDLFPGNVSASPDWPTDSEVARQVFGQVPGVGAVDGVVYVDPEALAALLELTGPVDVESIEDPLDAANLEQYLYVDQYLQYADDLELRRDVLAEVTGAVFEALTSRPLPALGDVIDTLGPAVSGGHLKFVAFDPAAEELFTRTGLAGAWHTTPGADWLSLRSTNLLPNKIDWFLRRSMEVDVEHDPATGEVRSTVTVTLRNEAPVGGITEYLTGNVDGLPPGTNLDGLALYTPHPVEGVTVDGTRVLLQAETGYGGNVYTVPVEIPPESTRVVVFELRGTVAPGGYLLDVLRQPLAHDDEVTIRVAQAGSPPVAVFEGPLTEDLRLDVNQVLSAGSRPNSSE